MRAGAAASLTKADAVFAVLLIALSMCMTWVWGWLGTTAGVPTSRLLAAVAVGMGAGAVYLLWLRRLHRSNAAHRSLICVMGFTGALMRLTALPQAPGLEDDYHRYMWDGAVLTSGVSPYRYSPEQAARAAEGCETVHLRLVELARDHPDELKHINHPHLRTIYPPVAQAWFALAHWLNPWSFDTWRCVVLLHDLATAGLLIGLLRTLRLPMIFAAVYWLNPLVVKELLLAGHMDALAFPWVMAALALAVRKRAEWAMAVLAIGASVKLWPILLIPLIVRSVLTVPRRLAVSTAAFTAVFFIAMLPMLVHERYGGSGLLRYATSWENNAGFFSVHSRLWAWVFSGLGYEHARAQSVTRYVTVALVCLWMSLWAAPRMSDDRAICRRAVWVVAGAFLIGPTQFPWYYIWLVPLMSLHPVRPLLLYTALMPLYYLHYSHAWVLWLEHGPVWAALAIHAIVAVRRRIRRPSCVATAADA